ncbi:MAG: hypothetical protein ACKVHE_20330 [Planctomycetales bacterium]
MQPPLDTGGYKQPLYGFAAGMSLNSCESSYDNPIPTYKLDHYGLSFVATVKRQKSRKAREESLD